MITSNLHKMEKNHQRFKRVEILQKEAVDKLRQPDRIEKLESYFL